MKPLETPPFEELDHTADLRLQVWGHSLRELFVHAAEGMFSLMRLRVEAAAEPVGLDVHLDSYDRETLLVDWLNELLYLSERDAICFASFDIGHLEATELDAHLEGYGPACAERGIKAVTFSDLAIEHTSSGLYTTIITFDV
ncbi:MAG: archease [Anaerolineae bacterium]|nr:archease [Anaerolineae bacterium]